MRLLFFRGPRDDQNCVFLHDGVSRNESYWVQDFQLYSGTVLALFYKSKLQFYHPKDPANKQTEDHYTNLQAKVADAVSIQYLK